MNVQRDTIVLAVDVGAGPGSAVVVLFLDAGLSDQVQVIGIEHFLVHEVRNPLDVHDANLGNVGAGLHGQRDLLIQVIRGHGGVVHEYFVLRSIERVHHGLHGSAVRAGEHGPVVDLDGFRVRDRANAQNHGQNQDQRQELLHGVILLKKYIV